MFGGVQTPCVLHDTDGDYSADWEVLDGLWCRIVGRVRPIVFHILDALGGQVHAEEEWANLCAGMMGPAGGGDPLRNGSAAASSGGGVASAAVEQHNGDGVDATEIFEMCKAMAEESLAIDATVLRSSVPAHGAILQAVAAHMVQIEGLKPLWLPELKHLALGLVTVFPKRIATDTGVHEHVELLHALCGGHEIIAHHGSSYTTKDGGWQKHRGVASETLLYAVRQKLLTLEGLCVWLAEANADAGDVPTLLDAIQQVYTTIGAGADTVIKSCQNKARYRAVAPVDDGQAPNTFSIWAGTLKKWSTTMQSELLGKSVYEMYGAWCSVPMEAASGLCFKDTCFLFTPTGLRYVQKSSQNFIYTHIDLPLLDPVLACNVERLARILSTTYWHNKAALECEWCGLCLALMGHNVDRAFWHLGRGGAGQSLTTSLFHAMLEGMHKYIDMNIYCTDDEFRKQGELLVDIPVATGQETVEGSANSLRFDLMKKHWSADPVAMRLLYSIITRMQELTGLKRYECNLLPSFKGINEMNFNSLMRRSWLMVMLARFVEKSVYDTIDNPSAKGIFLKDASAKAKPYCI